MRSVMLLVAVAQVAWAEPGPSVDPSTEKPAVAPASSTAPTVAPVAPSVAPAVVPAVAPSPKRSTTPSIEPAAEVQEAAPAPQPGIGVGWPATLASVTSLATSVAAFGVAMGTSGLCTEVSGSPKPLCLAGGVALGAALQAVVSWLVIPEVFRLSGAEASSVREGWWRWARWPLLGLAVATGVLAVAAGLEQSRFESGQAAMVGALAGTLSAGLTVDVLGVIGAVRAAEHR